jgi:hypothetical protein
MGAIVTVKDDPVTAVSRSAGFGVRLSMCLAPPVQLVAQVSRFGVRRR